MCYRKWIHIQRPRFSHKCGSLLINVPKKMTDNLQHALNAVARVVSNACIYDRGLCQFRQRELHWLDVISWVPFRLCLPVFKCLHNMAAGYLSSLCQPVFGVRGRRHLHLADRGHLDFPRVGLSTYVSRAFAYAGPTIWNLLPISLTDSSPSVFLSLIHIWRCRRIERCRSRWSPYH